jgi:pimeloyl-ACP methyl ester carboxylesterase
LPKTLIEPKTLIIFGEKDVALSVKGAKMSIDLCRDGILRTIQNGSHWIQQDCPEIVNQYIEEFIGV